MTNVISFCVSGENKNYFYNGALTAIKSVKLTNPHMPIVIFYDFLNEFQKSMLSGCKLIRVQTLYKTSHRRRELTDAIWFKFHLDALEGVDKALFLDCDLVVLDSLDEIFKLEGKIVACGRHGRLNKEFVDAEKVKANENIKDSDLLFNTGVICFDRKFWVHEKIKDKVLEILNMYGDSNFKNPDQGVANILAYRYGGFTNLSHRYNYLLDMIDEKPLVVIKNPMGVKAPYHDDDFIRILHWNGAKKPWRFKTRIKYSRNKKSYYSCYKQFANHGSLKELRISVDEK